MTAHDNESIIGMKIEHYKEDVTHGDASIGKGSTARPRQEPPFKYKRASQVNQLR